MPLHKIKIREIQEKIKMENPASLNFNAHLSIMAPHGYLLGYTSNDFASLATFCMV